MLDLKGISPDTAALATALLTDLLDGDIDNPETAAALREVGKLAVAFVRSAMKAKNSLLDMLAGPIVEKAILDAVEKFIKEKTAKPAA